MIEKEDKKIERGKRKIRRGTNTSNKVKRLKEAPLFRTSGNVTMATDGATYRFPNPYGAKQVTFFGNAVRYISGYSAVDIRADLFGMAQLAPSLYFTPQSTTSVGLAGSKQKLIQSGKYFLASSPVYNDNNNPTSIVTPAPFPEFRAESNETVLANVTYPNAGEVEVVARMEIVEYGDKYFDVKVNLGTRWEINGNFMCV